MHACMQERFKASKLVQRVLEPGRVVLVSDPSSALPTLGLLCGVLQPPGKGGFGSAAGLSVPAPVAFPVPA